MTFFIVLFLLLMQFLWRYIDELVGKGLEFKIIGELMLYAASSLVPLALPLAILLSSLMTFGNMGEFYELTAHEVVRYIIPTHYVSAYHPGDPDIGGCLFFCK